MKHLLILLSLFVLPASAQSRHEEIKTRVDSVLQKRYRRVTYDTAYIMRPKEKLTLRVRTNLSGNYLHGRGTVDGQTIKGDLKTALRGTINFGASYMGVAAALSLNPGSLSGRNKDYELNLSASSNRYCVDASYQLSKTLSGTMTHGDVVSDVEKGLVDMQMFNLTAYYFFNHRHFSYPAAFTQTYLQKRSAGSWLAGFAYQGGRFKTTDEASSVGPHGRIYVGYFGIGGGYGYHLVLSDKWLFHLSSLPMLIVFNRNNMTVDGMRRDAPTRFPEMILNGRFAVVRRLSARSFAGFTVKGSTSFLEGSNGNVRYHRWQGRIFLGFRL